MPDIIIRNGTIIDGSGGAAYSGDVAITGDRIEAVGDLKGATAPKTIDAQGCVVCPGFIDVHSHADITMYRDDHAKTLEPLVRQGITTFVGGNCGMALAPVGAGHPDLVAQYLEAFSALDFNSVVKWNSTGEFMKFVEDRGGAILNFAQLAPHGLIRIDAMGFANRTATDDEIRQMSVSLQQAMDDGAVGLSTGLQYFPGLKSETRELVALGKILKKNNGIFTSHLRSYSNTLGLAVDEVVEVARENEIPGQISHIFWVPDPGFIRPVMHKATAALAKLSQYMTPPIPLDGEINKQLKKLDRFRAGGTVNVRMDAMPTTTGFTHMFAFFPPWAIEGDMDAVIARLKDPEMRKKMLHDINKGKMVWPHLEDDAWTLNLFRTMGWTCVRIMSVVSQKNKHLEGRTLVSIAKERKCHPFDAACDLLLEENGKVLIFESMAKPEDNFTERSTFAGMRHPEVMISTDTILLGFGKPSYLFYAAYPKFISRYVRQKKFLSLETAIRKITGLAAEHFNLKHRGFVKEGYYADLVVFNPETIAPNATFENPCVYPEGIEQVIINGGIVVDKGGSDMSRLHGRVLRRDN